MGSYCQRHSRDGFSVEPPSRFSLLFAARLVIKHLAFQGHAEADLSRVAQFIAMATQGG
jgi:hypothetical protein